MYETLRMCSALDSLFTRFSPSKREISFLKTIPLFVNKIVIGVIFAVLLYNGVKKEDFVRELYQCSM